MRLRREDVIDTMTTALHKSLILSPRVQRAASVGWFILWFYIFWSHYLDKLIGGLHKINNGICVVGSITKRRFIDENIFCELNDLRGQTPPNRFKYVCLIWDMSKQIFYEEDNHPLLYYYDKQPSNTIIVSFYLYKQSGNEWIFLNYLQIH